MKKLVVFALVALCNFANQTYALSNSTTQFKLGTLCDQCGGGPHKPEIEKPDFK